MPILVGTHLVGRIAVRISKGSAIVEGHQLLDGYDPAHLNEALTILCRWAQATNIPVLGPSPRVGAAS
ncbi:hypothetical protein [Streptomyces sp. MH60]|uniref:hypothetical protein n=1 Tax=Streptomyces sp. MH60 TaxID=1940758 RepID=UPI000D4B0D6B|nr:hypothetical protein [Streptomyces sp. MH60]PPS91054.1 hypothetical protein BZZ08_00653 [Streptomyces sp. MH60]